MYICATDPTNYDNFVVSVNTKKNIGEKFCIKNSMKEQLHRMPLFCVNVAEFLLFMNSRDFELTQALAT